MSLREIQVKLRGQGWRILLESVLLIYWGMLIIGTFLLLN